MSGPQGDFFESHDRHNEFFGLLRDPKQFRLYKTLVIDRDEFVNTPCHQPREVVFPMAG